MNKVAVAIVTWNSASTIDNCLKRLQNLNVEVFVADNNSADGTVNKIEKYPRVKILRNKSNLGFGRANNIILKQVIADFEFIFLLNPDAQLTDNSLERMVEFMEKNREVGILGPKLLNVDGSLQKEMTPLPSLLDQILILLRLHRLPLFSGVVYPNYDYNKTQEAQHLMGSALLIRREVFDKIGLFDENFFLWFEETDLEKRAKEAGFKIVYFPQAAVRHLRSASIKKTNPLKRQTIWNKSLLYYFKKHHGLLPVLLLLPFVLFSYIPAAILALRRSL